MPRIIEILPLRNSLLRDTFDDLGTSPARDLGHFDNMTPFEKLLKTRHEILGTSTTRLGIPIRPEIRS